MKRTSVVLDTELLEEATRLGGQKTWSATIHRALQEFVRRVATLAIEVDSVEAMYQFGQVTNNAINADSTMRRSSR